MTIYTRVIRGLLSAATRIIALSSPVTTGVPQTTDCAPRRQKCYGSTYSRGRNGRECSWFSLRIRRFPSRSFRTVSDTSNRTLPSPLEVRLCTTTECCLDERVKADRHVAQSPPPAPSIFEATQLYPDGICQNVRSSQEKSDRFSNSNTHFFLCWGGGGGGERF